MVMISFPKLSREQWILIVFIGFLLIGNPMKWGRKIKKTLETFDDLPELKTNFEMSQMLKPLEMDKKTTESENQYQISFLC